MGAITHEVEVQSTIPPAFLFKALVLDFDTLTPKVFPQHINNVKNIEGNGGEGTIKLLTFAKGTLFESAKKHVDLLDEENMVYKYIIIVGEPLKSSLESISFVLKVDPSGDGGSVWKFAGTHHTNGDAEIEEIHTKGLKEISISSFKAIEAYIQANPNY